ncbi:9-O-acetylesterase [Bifidobacterium goeldii]|uniref:9-O-acetylesterase n=1 Tax=Bifidobacterium goeldii TaxID=2306975 RepID=A0A430FEN6_9BIFI|nr:sialate O-acetylesterase [Bifidobacterium goeldii]RSX51365.1 9-O-acetylesterase [Bifidobacterium goeldii]
MNEPTLEESTSETTPIVTGPAPGANLSGLAGATTNTSANKPLGKQGLRPAAIFSHDMVLQRGRPIPVFGTGEPGRAVIVTLTADSAGELLRLHTDTPADTHATDTPASTHASPTPATSSAASADSVSAHGTIDHNGNWLITLPALEAGGPYTLTVSDRSNITLKYLRVYVGEVWLAGGQSNMELELRSSAGADATIAASADPLLRFYNTPKSGVIDREAEDHAIWQVSGPETSGTMSAVAYYFARRLRAQLGPDVPVGIVDCYIGGTSITAWMSRAALETCEAGRGYLERFDASIAGKTDEQFEAETTAWKTKFDAWNHSIDAARKAEPDISWDTLNARYGECPWPPPETPTSQYRPTGPFGTMVERVAPYGIAGFLWYQGETDETYCESYRELLELMIAEWRGLWATPTRTAISPSAQATASIATSDNTAPLPFLIVQLPQWIDKNTASAHADPLRWPVIREAQWDAARTIANVFAITTIDCGEFDNLHPLDKRTPGERLADCALHNVYGRSDITADGPEVISTSTSDGIVTLQFAHASGLHFDGTLPGTYRHTSNVANTEECAESLHRLAAASGFEMAGTDGVFHSVEAAIHNESITLRSSNIAHPTAVRYAWRSWGIAPLFNGDGLPAPPFHIALH